MNVYYVGNVNLLRIHELKELSLFSRPIKIMLQSIVQCTIFYFSLLATCFTTKSSNMDRPKVMVPTPPKVKVEIVKRFQLRGCMHALQL